jgi:hypothetical protein
MIPRVDTLIIRPSPSSELSLSLSLDGEERWSDGARESAATTSSRALPLLLLPTMQPLHLHHCRRIRIHHFSWILADSPCPTNPAISIYMHPFLYLLHVYRSLVFYTFVPAGRPTKKIPNQRSASYLHRIMAALYTFPAFEANGCTRTYIEMMMVLKSVRLRSRPSGLKLSCIFSILKRPTGAGTPTPSRLRARPGRGPARLGAPPGTIKRVAVLRAAFPLES